MLQATGPEQHPFWQADEPGGLVQRNATEFDGASLHLREPVPNRKLVVVVRGCSAKENVSAYAAMSATSSSSSVIASSVA